MNKKSIIFLSVVSLVALTAAVFQYVVNFRADFASAYTTGKPLNGHLWSEMECSQGLCVTSSNKVGIGTDSPTQKLQVNGTSLFNGTTYVYNDSGDAKLILEPASGENGRKSILNFWSTFANYPNDKGTRLAGSITSGFSSGVWGTEYMSFGVGGAGDAANQPTEKMKLDYSGNLQTTGDVCNGSGKCLNSVFQTNVIPGSNPTCPTGQTMIMKAYNGTWYTADNSSITSWNKVTCGQTLNPDGTAWLVNSYHTQGQCTTAGGTVVSDGTYNMCRFSGSSCPGGWYWYGGWSAVSSVGCSGVCTSCTAGPGHDWSNNSALPTCVYKPLYGENGCSDSAGSTCSSTRTQIGCY